MLYLKIGENKYIKLEELEKARSHKYVSRKPDGKGGWIYSYYKKPAENRYALNYNDVRDFGYDKAVQIYKDTENIRNKPIEHSFVYDKNGNEIFNKIGNEKGIDFTEQEQDLIRNSKLMIHNHPNNSDFSDKDFNLLLKLNIQEIRAFGNSINLKTKFSIKRININEQQRIEFRRKYIEDLTIFYTDLKQKNMLGLISAKDANKQFAEKSIEFFHKYNKGYYEHGKF